MMTKAEALNELNEIKRNTQHNGYMWASDVENLFYKIYDAYEAQLKAKDEEIKRLNCRAYHAEGYINDLHNQPKAKKFYDAKARSIVAMLFWEWRKAHTSYKKSRTEKPKPTKKTISLRGMKASQCERLFKQAYKMLKDNA